MKFEELAATLLVEIDNAHLLEYVNNDSYSCISHLWMPSQRFLLKYDVSSSVCYIAPNVELYCALMPLSFLPHVTLTKHNTLAVAAHSKQLILLYF